MAKAQRSLAGKVVAITGGGRGIGRATAAALITQGARVAIGDIQPGLAEKTAEELGGGTIGLPLDVTDRANFAKFLDTVEERLGPLDVLVNNAGIMPVGHFVQETDATAHRMVDINLHGVISGSKLALERFQRRGRGHLVNIASSAGKVGAAGGATYSATKFGVVGLSEALRMEFGRTGIDISIVMPVGVNTELYSGLPALRGFKTAEPEDVGNAIVEALQTGRVDVFVPRSLGRAVRVGNMVPRRISEFITRVTKGDQVLLSADHVGRAAYLSRTADPVLEGAAPTIEPAPEPEPEPETQPV
jgi:NAD(P)-dependent dehydrogenase (short-subunit alcohol dehydrogenase family)